MNEKEWDVWPLDRSVNHHGDMTLWIGPNEPIYFPSKPSRELEKAILKTIHAVNPKQAVSCEWDMSYRIETGD